METNLEKNSYEGYDTEIYDSIFFKFNIGFYDSRRESSR